jgi:hypothetical protein
VEDLHYGKYDIEIGSLCGNALSFAMNDLHVSDVLTVSAGGGYHRTADIYGHNLSGIGGEGHGVDTRPAASIEDPSATEVASEGPVPMTN